MTFLFDLLVSIIFAYLIFFLLNYFLFKFDKVKSHSIFTEDISTESITFTKNYQEILGSQLEKGTKFNITLEKLHYLHLSKDWGITDIKLWIESLENRDNIISIEVISNNYENLTANTPRIILSKEFMVNNKSDPVLISRLIVDQLIIFSNLFNIDNNDKYSILIHFSSLIVKK